MTNKRPLSPQPIPPGIHWRDVSNWAEKQWPTVHKLRMQAAGEHRAERKRIWIEPCLIAADKKESQEVPK